MVVVADDTVILIETRETVCCAQARMQHARWSGIHVQDVDGGVLSRNAEQFLDCESMTQHMRESFQHARVLAPSSLLTGGQKLLRFLPATSLKH